MINGSLIREVREFRGLTQAGLALAASVDQSTIHYLESGRREPGPGVLERIAKATGFPAEFFTQGPTPEDDFPLGSLLLFRARASVTARQENQARSYAKIACRMLRLISERVTSIPLRLPQLHESPPLAAEITRASWGLSPDQPLPSLTRVVERQGIVVVALPLEIPSIDAFSVWRDKQPVIAVLQGKPNDRLRFSIAHELGHLVMHQVMKGDIQGIESEAQEFAGEFLLPEMAVRDDFKAPLTLTALARLKVRWRVSMQMLAMRAYELGAVTPRQRTYLFQQMSARGWRKKEPLSDHMPDERPRALRQIAEMVYGDPIDYGKLAGDVHLPIALVQSIVEAHAPKSPPTPEDNILQYPESKRAS